MAAVMIGAGPHKGSHTAVAIGAAEEPLGGLRVRASAAQAQRLVAWAAGWPERTWAAGGARGLGHLLAWQLIAAGERVLDVQPKLGARVRLLTAGVRAELAKGPTFLTPGCPACPPTGRCSRPRSPVRRLVGRCLPVRREGR